MIPYPLKAWSPLAAAVLCLAACAGPDPSAGDVSPAALAAILGPERPFEPRLSIAPVHRPCARDPGSRLCRPLPPAGSEAHARVLRLAARAGALADSGVDAGVLRVLGLVELLWAGPGNPAGESVQLLEEAVLVSPADPDLRADLAAARLVRYEAGGSAADLLHALEAARAALEIEPGHPVALFNLALTWEQLGLAIAAMETWESVADAGPGDGWAREARSRATRLARDRPVSFTGALALPSATPAALRAAATADPEGAREWAMDFALPAWGRAMIAGDDAAAARWLTGATAVGDALAAAGLDRTVQQTARSAASSAPAAPAAPDAPDAPGAPAAPAAPDVAGPSRLARLLAGYGEARQSYRKGDYAGSRAAFAALDEAATAADEPLRGWIRFYHGASLGSTGAGDAGDRRFREALAGIDESVAGAGADRYPVLAGRVIWARSVAAARAGRWAEAAGGYREALDRLDRAGERMAAGALEGLLGGAEQELGSPHAALERRHRSLERLGGGRGSVWLHNGLMQVSAIADGLGLHRAAIALQTEGVATAVATGLPVYEAEALVRRARLFLRQGRQDDAMADAERARRLAERVESASSRAWLRADLLELAGDAVMAGPATADGLNGRVAALDTAAAYFESLGNVVRLAPVLGARARVSLRAGRVADAEADLRRVVAIVEAQSRDRDDPAQRAALLDAARPAFDALVGLELARGRGEDALAIAEQGRASPGPRVSAAARPAPRELAARVPGDAAAIAYAVLGESIAIWTLRAGTVHVRQVPAGDDLDRVIERVRLAGARGASGAALAADLETLHDRLLEPVFDRITGALDLVVVPDGRLHDVPFAALRSRDGYLVERVAVRVLPALADLRFERDDEAHGRAFPGARGRADSEPDPDPRPGGALLVAAPAGGPGLPPLPGAAREVAALRALYRDADALEPGAGGGMAGGGMAGELERRLPAARLFHFAGHAVSDPDRPDRSFLHLEPGEGGRLTADAIRRLPLDGLELAVLSACHTLTAAGTRSGGFDGVARSFLAAGTRGVLGTLWEVDDAVARELAVRFHEEHRTGRTPAEALRAAQRALLHSGDPALASPAAWAAFRYVGR